MSDTVQSQSVGSTSWLRRVITLAVLMSIVFLLGFGPMWYKKQLNLARIQNILASSAINAWQGNYEQARLSASVFFTSLLAETERQNDSFLSQAEKKEIFIHRDEIITLLARNDPASANKLSDLYVLYRNITKKR